MAEVTATAVGAASAEGIAAGAAAMGGAAAENSVLNSVRPRKTPVKAGAVKPWIEPMSTLRGVAN
jgi:hypothetical protein